MISPVSQVEAQRILRRAARRLFAEDNADAIGPPAGSDADPLDHSSNEVTPLGQRQPGPVIGSHDHRGTEAA